MSRLRGVASLVLVVLCAVVIAACGSSSSSSPIRWMVSTPTCGACFGGGMGVPAAGETAVTTTHRNFKGRMGSPDARVYLADAWVAAAAAVAGELVDPGELIEAPA